MQVGEGGKYKVFEYFTKKEMMAHLGVYLLHGISPAPQIEMKSISSLDNPVNGSNMCNKIFGRAGKSRDEMNFISICGSGEIPWSRYTPKCAIISFFVKSSNPLYLTPLLPAFDIIAFVFVQYRNSSIVTALGCVFLARGFGKENI